MILKTFDGIVMRVSDEEAAKIAQAIHAGNKHLAFRGALIPVASVALYPDDLWDARHEHKEPEAGRLHDGTRVIKQFGRWVDAGDDKLRLDPHHYPEIARDEVLLEREYEAARIAQLPPDQRRQAYDLAATTSDRLAGKTDQALIS